MRGPAAASHCSGRPTSNIPGGVPVEGVGGKAGTGRSECTALLLCQFQGHFAPLAHAAALNRNERCKGGNRRVFSQENMAAPARPPLPPLYDVLLKIILLGDDNVGKSALAERFAVGMCGNRGLVSAWILRFPVRRLSPQFGTDGHRPPSRLGVEFVSRQCAPGGPHPFESH